MGILVSLLQLGFIVSACILSLPRRSGIADWSPGEKCQCILSAATPLPEGRSRSNINISVRWTLVERTLFDPIGTYHIMVSNKIRPIIHDTINHETHCVVTIVSIDKNYTIYGNGVLIHCIMIATSGTEKQLSSRDLRS